MAMQVSIEVTRRGEVALPKPLFSADEMRGVGSLTVALIQRRTQQGKDAFGRPFKPYSVTPIYISKRGETGMRLSPKGGRTTPSGKSVHYLGGYRAYKAASTGSGKVNLTLSGELLRGVHVTSASPEAVTISVKSGDIRRAEGISRTRPFVGLSEKDEQVVREEFDDLLQAKIDRRGGAR